MSAAHSLEYMSYRHQSRLINFNVHSSSHEKTCFVALTFQVSEVYKLHRETYHLAQDYFDRFMATQRNVFKSTLQLIGITCLFIAAKVEVKGNDQNPCFKSSWWFVVALSHSCTTFSCFSIPRRCILPRFTGLRMLQMKPVLKMKFSAWKSLL